ncbi:MAG: hypothetical protein COV99_01415 [Bacteroidetes bacterium CG12_big_fil_rev_8_21_14_0_65_60_17]|nr:MAG: hypothetical protein COV99_01415 [Bacteroidetes bacterium CG12_big_fil_rev_8_21_14_0_65_60_17]
MAYIFTESDIQRVEDVLGVLAKRGPHYARYELADEASGRKITLEIHMEMSLPTGEITSLVSVYAVSSFLQIQGCTGFKASKELGEVIFVARSGDTANGLVVEREAGCSLYANVNTALLSTDFTQLPPELIMSSVALSVTEDLFGDLG